MVSKIIRSCLMDEASTVRQMASTVLQKVTSKSTELTMLALSTLCRFTDAVIDLSGKSPQTNQGRMPGDLVLAYQTLV